MRYDFECSGCGIRHELTCRMSDRPNVTPCPSCGGESRQVFLSVPESFMKNRPYEFNGAKNVRSNGRMFGRSDEKQHEHYRKAFDLQRTMNKQRRRSGGKGESNKPQWIGGMPGEMADSIVENEGGDKNVVLRDPVAFLKKTGLYAGDD